MKKTNYGTIVLMIGLMMCVSCSQVSFNNPFGEAQPNAAGMAGSDESSDKVDPQNAGKPPEHKIRYLNVKNADNSANPTSFKESETVMLTKVSISGFTFDGWYEVT
ncbi:MAG: hypothetical protein IKP67_03335, partial [Spirochaetales bacterium]|nr:hypothetical protein [Spirochaetales bacterium]